MTSRHGSRAEYPDPPTKKEHKSTLHDLQVELFKPQKHIITGGDRILVLFEGRDSGGMDSTIKRIVQHLSPRETRVVALGKPSERDRTSWYFRRYVSYLSAAEEMVLFNRSWYIRAGVEQVMGYCNDLEYETLLEIIPSFERMLLRSGILLFKYYLDISRHEQKKRLDARREEPLKQWKMSPIDAVARQHRDAYSTVRNGMFARTHSPAAPWTVVRADNKKLARLNVIRDLLARLDYADKDHDLTCSDLAVVFRQAEACIANHMITP